MYSIISESSDGEKELRFKLHVPNNPSGERVEMEIDGVTYMISRKDFKAMFKAMRKQAHELYDIRSKGEEIVEEYDDDIEPLMGRITPNTKLLRG